MKKRSIYAGLLRLLLPVTGVLAINTAKAQYNVEVLSSTTVYVTGGTTVCFKGTDFVSASDIQGSGPVIFNGSTAQNLNMKNYAISGITMDNPNHVTLLDSVTVSNTTLFTAGNILLGNYRLDQKGIVEGQGSTGGFEGNGNSILSFSGSGGTDTFFMVQTTPNSTNRLKDLRVDRNGATVTCGDTVQIRGVVYHFDGTINANDSRLKLKALSTTSYGQVAGVGSGTISDTMYAEFQIGSSVQSPLNQWRHFTSPFTNASLADELGDDITINFSPVQSANVWTFDQTRLVNSWRPVEADEDMHNNHYAVYLWGISSGHSPSDSDFMIDMSGTYPGTGNYHRLLGRNNPNSYTGQAEDDTVGWHMIPNPYPSNMSFQYQADLEGGSSYYVWDISGDWRDSSGCGGCKARATYATYRADNGLSVNGGRSVIPPFHVFYVRASIDSAVFNLGNSWRTTDSSYNHIGRKTSEFDLLHVKATSPEKVTDEIYLWFNKYSADNKFDKLDGLKLLNAPESPSIYTLTADGKKAVFNVMKEINDDYHSVEMPFSSTTKGTFNLEFTFENPDQVETITLEDRKTGTLRDVLANTSYSFEHDGNTKMKDRFVLHFQRKGGATAIEDYLAETQPVQISTDSRNIMVRFPVIKQNGALITVYDMLGRQVMDTRKVDTNSEIYVIDGTSLASGYYTVKVQTGNEVKSAPVFIAR